METSRPGISRRDVMRIFGAGALLGAASPSLGKLIDSSHARQDGTGMDSLWRDLDAELGARRLERMGFSADDADAITKTLASEEFQAQMQSVSRTKTVGSQSRLVIDGEKFEGMLDDQGRIAPLTDQLSSEGVALLDELKPRGDWASNMIASRTHDGHVYCSSSAMAAVLRQQLTENRLVRMGLSDAEVAQISTRLESEGVFAQIDGIEIVRGGWIVVLAAIFIVGLLIIGALWLFGAFED